MTENSDNKSPFQRHADVPTNALPTCVYPNPPYPPWGWDTPIVGNSGVQPAPGSSAGSPGCSSGSPGMRKREAMKEKTTTAEAERTDARQHLGGSHHADWNNLLALQVLQAVGLQNVAPEIRDIRDSANMVALMGIAPRDELEGMMAAQLIAAHNATMACYRRAASCEQRPQLQQENLNQANKLSRTYAVLLEALNRHRGKGQQKVTVEHVHVYPGGQAVVGTVEAGGQGRVRAKIGEQPDAIGYAAGLAVPREIEAERAEVPRAGGSGV
jgi:hypothetical protein